jgi:hypothetical protein
MFKAFGIAVVNFDRRARITDDIDAVDDDAELGPRVPGARFTKLRIRELTSEERCALLAQRAPKIRSLSFASLEDLQVCVGREAMILPKLDPTNDQAPLPPDMASTGPLVPEALDGLREPSRQFGLAVGHDLQLPEMVFAERRAVLFRAPAPAQGTMLAFRVDHLDFEELPVGGMTIVFTPD